MANESVARSLAARHPRVLSLLLPSPQRDEGQGVRDDRQPAASRSPANPCPKPLRRSSSTSGHSYLKNRGRLAAAARCYAQIVEVGPDGSLGDRVERLDAGVPGRHPADPRPTLRGRVNRQAAFEKATGPSPLTTQELSGLSAEPESCFSTIPQDAGLMTSRIARQRPEGSSKAHRVLWVLAAQGRTRRRGSDAPARPAMTDVASWLRLRTAAGPPRLRMIPIQQCLVLRLKRTRLTGIRSRPWASCLPQGQCSEVSTPRSRQFQPLRTTQPGRFHQAFCGSTCGSISSSLESSSEQETL